VAIEAQIAHSARKVTNANKLREQVLKDVEKKEEKLNFLQKDLVNVRKAADAAQGNAYTSLYSPISQLSTEAQGKASRNNTSLSEESLEEYRKL
jgi:structural maintenance of chromosome 1